MHRSRGRPTGPVSIALMMVLGGLALTGCADDEAAPASARPGPVAQLPQRTANIPAAARPAGAASFSSADEQSPLLPASGEAGQPIAQDDPSAPLDTPLCGRAARERIAMDAALEPAVIPGAGACADTACFDPATDTYIGADGYRHVCQ